MGAARAILFSMYRYTASNKDEYQSMRTDISTFEFIPNVCRMHILSFGCGCVCVVASVCVRSCMRSCFYIRAMYVCDYVRTIEMENASERLV